MNTATAEKIELPTKPAPAVRRFDLPDFDKHMWIRDRLLRAFPHLTDRSLRTWFMNALYSNEYRMFYQDNAVAMFLMEPARPLVPQPLVREIFVLCNKGAEEEASWFYPEAMRWAEHMGATVLIVEEGLCDVPHEFVRARFESSRVFTRTQHFVKAKPKQA